MDPASSPHHGSHRDGVSEEYINLDMSSPTASPIKIPALSRPVSADDDAHHSRLPSAATPVTPSSGGGAATKAAPVYKFVLTGGPCSGKTTAMTLIQSTLRELGYRVFTTSEAATMYFLSGVNFADLVTHECQYAFQTAVLRTQVSIEDSLERFARATGQRSVVMCDRAAMDGSAYIEDDAFDRVLEDSNLNRTTANTGRYDAVFHLVTAADGAEGFYTLANNQARTETVEMARIIDRKSQRAWSGHPHHFIIDNSGGSFEAKLDTLLACLLHCVGHLGGERPVGGAIMPRTPSVKSLSGGGLSSPDLSSFGNYSHSHDHGNTTSTGAGTGTSGEHSDLPPAPTIVSAGVHHFTVGEIDWAAFFTLADVKVFEVDLFVLKPQHMTISAVLPLFAEPDPLYELVKVELQRQTPIKRSDITISNGRGGRRDERMATFRLHVTRRHVDSGEIVQTRRIISYHDFYSYIASDVFEPVHFLHRRYCFLWNNQVFHYVTAPEPTTASPGGQDDMQTQLLASIGSAVGLNSTSTSTATVPAAPASSTPSIDTRRSAKGSTLTVYCTSGRSVAFPDFLKNLEAVPVHYLY